MLLNNKVAIITGGTGALGRSVIVRFIENGTFVTSTYIVKREQDECIKLIDDNTKCNFIKADVTKEKEVKNLIGVTLKNNNRIDFLINIVGGFTSCAIVDTDEKIFDKMINMNLRSTFLCCKNVIPHMIKNKYGRIINIAARPALKGMAG
ncbi:MAG: SDR family NAD(P)-dependent oxidoreductase, partial [Thermodesulfobacteriota bacterium]